MHKALYRSYRPQNFEDVVGQEHIIRTLKNQIENNNVGHAYLFSGTRGTGKTSTAKIFARAVNCENSVDQEPCNECEVCRDILNDNVMDVVEIDAASNNSVDDIRELRESVKYSPAKAKYKVYIIDEVHMLSQGAFNALLKTLEEPPSYVIFILATTEPHKIPATILSRCQRFDFKRLSNASIIKRLETVCQRSNIEITKEAMNIVATLADGAMRDALSILERCVQDGENKIDEDKIKDLVGIPKITYIHNITEAIIDYDIDKVLENLDIVLNEGKDIVNLLWEMIKYTKDILVYKTSKKLDLYSQEELKQIEEIAQKASKEKLIDIIYKLSNLENDIKFSTQKTIIFQAGIIKMCNKQAETEDNLSERIDKIEKYLKSGNIAVGAGVAVQTSAVPQVPRVTQAPPRSNTSNNVARAAKAQTPKNFSNKSEEYWPQIITDLKQSGKIVLYTNLLGTKAKEINDMTVGIEFPNGMTSFGKTVLEKQENIREISNLVSIACGKEMQIKYIEKNNQVHQMSQEETLQNLANQSDIPFNII